ncbi:metallophosphoesterase family protein [Aquibacillus salsiterrae]|uniref:DNA repair exonuclease n=1 Tax=Aquibacillus salsiterrae TaxID=2950439 RepID=A0A9X3WH02_9BACI|nr:DNA repair exonuclease [Aquibacillus salsiterrae]MDC3417284.1 DNA repair exonuclease [Aquibacillus salsiterrae]
MSDKISFIHCADLHIDSPFKGLSSIGDKLFKEIHDSTYTALDNLVQLALDKQVDFVLIVGDLFDSEQQSMKAQTKLRKAFERLEVSGVQVYLSYGNHDYTGGRVFDIGYPPNVHSFQSEQVTNKIFYKNGTPIASIYGFSYQSRAVYDNKSKEFEITNTTPFHIGMLHGSVNTNTEHDVYAPFQVKDLLEKPVDYWALGHIHKSQVLKDNPPIIYPGNIQGRSKKESGEKGCFYVEMDEHGSAFEFFPLQHIRFETLPIHVRQCRKPQDIETLMEETIDQLRKRIGKCILKVELESDSELLETWGRNGTLQDIVDYLNEFYEKETEWVFIQEIKLVQTIHWNRNQLINGQHFIGELLQSFENTTSIDDSVQPLFSHRTARKHIKPFTNEEELEILKEAEQYLVYRLLKD